MKCPTASAFWWGWGMPSGTQHGWAQLPLRLMEKAQGTLTVVHAPMQSRSPLALIMLLLRGPNGWWASRAVAVGCLWYSRHCVLALYPLPADQVGHFFLFQKLNHRACAASSGYVTPDEPLSWSVSAIPGHSGQQSSGVTHGGHPRETQEVLRIVLVHTVITGQERLS